MGRKRGRGYIYFADIRPFRVIAAVALTSLAALVPVLFPLLIGAVIDGVSNPRFELEDAIADPFVYALVGLLCVALFGFFCQRAAVTLSANVANDVLFRIRSTELLPLFEQDWRSVGEDRSESLTRLTQGVDAIQRYVEALLESIGRSCFVITGTLVILLSLDWLLALPFIVLFCLAALLFKLSLNAQQVRYGRTQASAARIVEELTQSVQLATTDRIFGRTPRRLDRLHRLEDRYQSVYSGAINAVANYGGWVRGVGNGALCFAVVLGTLAVYDGRITVGTLTAFVLYSRQLFTPLEDLTQFFDRRSQARVAVSRLTDLRESGRPRASHTQGELPQGVLVRVHHLVVKHEADAPVLNGLDLELLSGQTTLLVGETGAGKTSLGRAIGKLDSFQGGHIIFSRPMNVAQPAANVAYAPQSDYLIPGTVRQNLMLGAQELKDYKLRMLAERTGLIDALMVEELDLESDLTDVLNEVSAELRQLISLVRVLACNARLLIFDEPAASLNESSYLRAVGSVPQLLDGRSALVIAHRLTLAPHVDRIVVLENGKVVEQGTYDELTSRGQSRFNRALVASVTADESS